ncbi:OmpP1/FadL family transporter [Salinimicrobium sp. GXAS 041]|uniref:OmpP1/FadL family transporter n=1 Tax=Salinimicrobium sp. GXAS 041 TaxID=3400806 RepID=UPI003C743BAF
MKRLIFAFIAMTSMVVEAQNITDAVRYSRSDLNGTARYRAMSGAFGALGGDLSSLNVNPAGSAVFLNSFAGFSLGVNNLENDTQYFNGSSSSSNSNIDLGQAGGVFVFNSYNEENDWRKFTVGFNYTKSSDYEDQFLAAGTNQRRSIDSYYLGYANGVPLDLLIPVEGETVAELYSWLGENRGFGAQQALLGYQAYLINANDPENFENTLYSSNIAPGNFEQEYAYATTGLNGKFSFNFATQYKDDWYLGLNLNTHFINYDRITTLFETNNNPGSGINEVYLEDRLSTLGSGFSFQLGAIGKIGKNLRIGGSYESPTWYSISEETTQYLETYSEAEGEAIVDPQILNIYPEYTLQTPSKYTGSVALLLGGRGLVSFDYSYKDYSSTKFKPAGDPEFTFQNDLMAQELKAASSYRIGGEYRLMAWSLRGGYRLEESPYHNESTIGDLHGYSFGLGYNFGNARLDLAYDAFEQENNPQLFQVGLTDTAQINRNNSNYTLTLSFGI